MVATLIIGADPLEYRIFQAIFGEILTLLNALLGLAAGLVGTEH